MCFCSFGSKLPHTLIHNSINVVRGGLCDELGFTFASICLVSGFWNKNLILLLPSSEEPLSWENLYLQSTA